MDVISIVVIVLVCLYLLGEGTWKRSRGIIEQTEREAITPNYYEIARMERALFGQTWHEAFNDNGKCACDICTDARPIYTSKDLVRPVNPPANEWEDRYGN